MEIKSYRAIARGAVQGVGFRYTARHLGSDCGLCGYAKNLSDGTVEMVLHGDAEQIELFLKKIREEFGLQESAIALEEVTLDPLPLQFEIRF